ncbi:MAG TPA: signal peptidase II [Caulobacteraceae bacterium]
MGADLKITRDGWIAYALALVTALLDQWSKAYVTGPLDLVDRGSIAILPFFHLTSVANPGVSFGLLRADTSLGRWLLVGFSAVVVVGLAVWAARQTRIWTALATGLIMGGAIGNNLIDRARFGAVVDFLDFSGLGFKWVFNVADSAITVGVALLLLDSLLSSNKPAASASS